VGRLERNTRPLHGGLLDGLGRRIRRPSRDRVAPAGGRIVVAQHTRDPPPSQQRQHFVGLRAVAHQVAGAQDDIDAVAVEVSAHNARLNHAPNALDLYVAPGLRHAKANRPGRFDLVFANILAGPLKQLAPSIARVLARDGTLILSGLLAMDVPGVASAYRHHGIYLVSRSLREGWATLVMKKGGAAPRPRRPA